MMNSNVVKVIDHSQFKVSPNDTTRKYRHVKLSNELDCLLVSDSTTDKSAACCDVHVGAMADPIVAQGLAHFLEHMLFMGTEAYPDENAYQAYLSNHGGSSNAYTDQENTVYYFDIQPDYLETALDMFASFFVCPLFNESSTLREINAVDSENSKNLQSDMWRSWQLLKSMAKSTHPFSSFSTGNLQTLKENTEANGLNIRDLLLSFYDKYYSANLMKVCIYGKEDLDVMQKWVEEKFAKIPNKNLERPKIASDPFGAEEVGKIVHMVPIRDSKLLELHFQLPPVDCYWEIKPSKYLSHLIGHESEGSILSALKANGWANSLSSGISTSYKDFAFLNVDIDLSEEGSKHIDEIIACVFTYVAMIKREGVQDWIAQEIKDISDMNYRFLEKIQPTEYVMKLASGMQTYAPEYAVSSPYIVEKVDVSIIPELLDCIRPENLLILYKNKSLTTSKKEKWYNTDYEDTKISQESLSLWTAAYTSVENNPWVDKLYLPKKNPFIPTDFNIRNKSSEGNLDITLLNRITSGQLYDMSVYESKPSSESPVESALAHKEVTVEESANDEKDDENGDVGLGGSSDPSQPMQLYSGKLIQTWFKPDNRWNVPLLFVVVMLETSVATNSPLGFALADLLSHVLKEALNEFAYYADCAGLHYDIQLAKGGLELTFYGYNDKLSILVLKALEEMKKLIDPHTDKTKSEAVFNRMKEKVLRNYYNTSFWQPYNHAIMGTSLCLEEPRWSNAEKHRALFSVSFNDFLSFSAQFINSLKAEVLIHGNSSADEAKTLSSNIVTVLGHQPLPVSMIPIRRVVKIDEGKNYIFRLHAKHFNPAEANSAVDIVYFVGGVTGAASQSQPALHTSRIRHEALLSLLVQIMADKAFDQLRTKEQLGYIVFTGVKKIGQYIGLQLVVQSNHKDPSYLDGRVENFLRAFLEDLTTPRASSTEEENAPSTYIDDKALEEFIQATIEKLLEQPKNLYEESQTFMEEIRLNTYLFDRKKQLASFLQTKEEVTRAKIVEFFKTYVIDNQTRSKFACHFYGGKCLISERDEGIIIKDPADFKRDMTLLPIIAHDSAFKSNA